MQLAASSALVIFDLDGTLADTISDIAAAVNRTLSRFNVRPHEVDAYKLMVGEGFRLLMQKALPPELADNGSLVERALEIALADYSENCLVHTSLFPGVPELLRVLAKSGRRLAVLSNKPDPMTKSLVKTLCGQIEFVAVWGNSPDRPRKPDPAAALRIAAMAGVEPQRCIFVGDSSTDMQTARAAGMIAVGAEYGYRSHEELAGAGAQFFIRSPFELADALGLSSSS